MLTILNSDNNENGHEKQIKFVYTNALSTQNLEISTTHDMSDYQTETFTNSMQYVHIYEINNDSREEGKETELLLHVSKQDWIKAIQRCSLIRGLYEIVAEGDTYNELIQNSLELNSLHDLMVPDGVNVNSTWRVRLRQYGITAASSTKSKQYGKKMRSPMTQEREAVNQLKDLLIQFGGAVDLKDANVSIYVLEGLMGINPKSSSSQQNPNLKTLARLLIKGGGGQSGLATSSIAPNTRICVTNTPLAPIEAFTLCNVARIRNGDRVLDPFAGSCTTLLAASMLCNDCQSVGIEIAYDSQVNKTNILEDFNVRNLTKPQVIIRGDAMDEEIREKARLAVGNQPFDCIVTGEKYLRLFCSFIFFIILKSLYHIVDPPYGIREKKGYCEDPPLVDLVNKIAQDRHQNKRLLKKFGRLVAFVPNPKGEDVALGMPSKEALDRAGLELSLMVEQPLNDSLSRWLVAYECIR
jgi:tRNA G10  N-methylase Trm11